VTAWLYTDWVELIHDDAEFQEACDDLGKEIPLGKWFRRSLRAAIKAAAAAAAQPVPTAAPQHAVSTGLPLVSPELPAFTGAAAEPSTPGSSYAPQQPQAQNRRGTLHPKKVGAAQPTAASAQQSKSTSTVDTVHMTAAAEVPPGEIQLRER
jgi:hypothetical protein